MDGIFRLDMGEPVPEPVFECLSPTTAAWKPNGKMQLYAALGIKEYPVCDPGGMRASGAPARLLVHRLKDGAYRVIQANPELSAPDRPACASEVFGTHVRMQPWAQQPDEMLSDLRSRFQWHDAAGMVGRDPETDKQIPHEREVPEGCVEAWMKGVRQQQTCLIAAEGRSGPTPTMLPRRIGRFASGAKVSKHPWARGSGYAADRK